MTGPPPMEDSDSEDDEPGHAQATSDAPIVDEAVQDAEEDARVRAFWDELSLKARAPALAGSLPVKKDCAATPRVPFQARM